MIAEWFLPTLFSAAMLGVYDICKKAAVKDNAVMPALFLATLSGTLFFLLSNALTGQLASAVNCSFTVWLLTLSKSLLVAASWVCVFYAMRELPITLASPIRATSPLWTAMGGILIYREIPTLIQALGMAIVFTGYILFSLIGRTEGFSCKSKGIILIAAGTLLGACSALYDKFLLNTLGIEPQVLQLYFSLNLVVVLGAAYAVRSCFGHKHAFHWRWSIPLTGILLIMADYAYFYVLSCDDAPISLVSLVRRCNCIITFAAGAKLFNDRLLKRKAAALAVLLAGVLLIALG